LGLLLKAVYITAISVPEEGEKALDERAQMGAIGDMQAYLQFKAARALGDAALAGAGEGGSMAGLGVSLGAGLGLGTAMVSAIGQAVQGPAGGGGAAAAPGAVPAGGSLADGPALSLSKGFAGLKQLVAQQLTLSAEEREAATVALDALLTQLASSTSTMEDVKAARNALIGRFPWLEGPVKTFSKFGAPVVNPADREVCRPVLRTPLVLVAWNERATALWGGDPDSELWQQLYDALTQPNGWGAYGHPEWGYVKFSHTNPLKSNSGFQTILLLTYNYFDKTSGLTGADILSDAEYQRWFTEFEGSISSSGDSTGTYMEEIIAYGPSLHDVVAVYEATAVEHAENAVGRYGELQIYYPPATHMSDHPFCVLQAE